MRDALTGKMQETRSNAAARLVAARANTNTGHTYSARVRPVTAARRPSAPLREAVRGRSEHEASLKPQSHLGARTRLLLSLRARTAAGEPTLGVAVAMEKRTVQSSHSVRSLIVFLCCRCGTPRSRRR